MSSSHEKYEVPELLYDEPSPNQQPNPFPFVNVKKGSRMPPVIFIEERKQTGETEPGPSGQPQEIVDCLMHKYVDLELIKEKLPPHMNDIVRVALGMKPLKEAEKLGRDILTSARTNVEKLLEEARNNKTKNNKKVKDSQ